MADASEIAAPTATASSVEATTSDASSTVQSASVGDVGASASIVHANHGRSASSAHICSNHDSCPLIAAWEAAAPAARDSIQLSDELFACSACSSVLYCSTDCQRRHWMEGGHKAECAKVRASSEAAAAAAASQAATPSTSTSSTAAAAPTVTPPRHRDYRVNLNIACGPRGIIILFLLLYLIYRVSRGRTTDIEDAHGDL